MDPLSPWLHLDDQYMWQWYCSDAAGRPVPIGRWWFNRADAERAMELAQASTAQTKQAA